MASFSHLRQLQSLYKKPQFTQSIPLPQQQHNSLSIFTRTSNFYSTTTMVQGLKFPTDGVPELTPLKKSPPLVVLAGAEMVAAAVDMEDKRKKSGDGGFVDEMRSVAMRLHTKDQAKEGEKPAKGPEEKSPSKWNPTIIGYLKFLVDSKLVYETLECIVEKASVPYYAEFRNTGLERSDRLSKDLEWFKEQGYEIPDPSEPGITYASYLEELAEKDPQGFICHFYNVYFAHSAGGRMIGRKVGEAILNKKDLEFYKWDGELPKLLQNVRDKLNKVAESWSREEKNHCLEETEKSFKYSGHLLRLILSSSD